MVTVNPNTYTKDRLVAVLMINSFDRLSRY